jgi:hypothetical protein
MIKQRLECDCAIACLAMAAGVRWIDVWTHRVMREFRRHLASGIIRGLYDGEEEKFLNSIGIRNKRLAHQDSFYNKEIGIERGYTTEQLFEFIINKKAILCVPSLNVTDGLHDVYWDGTRFYDPSFKKTYASIDIVGDPRDILLIG